MPTDDFYTPTDLDALRMENDLLAFEVRYLKAQSAEPERTAEGLRRTVEGLRERLRATETTVKELEGQLAEKKRAEQDLILLLGRLTESPLAPVLGMARSFRVLRRRYLDA